VLPPEKVVARFNDLMTRVIETDHYVTIAFALVDLQTGQVQLTQAGHPHPVVQRACGRVEFAGEGGLPVGLIEGAAYARVDLVLGPGDRLLLCSDGLTECPGPDGAMLDEDGLAAMLRRGRDTRGQALLETLVWDLAAFHGSDQFPDDLSAVLFEYGGPNDGDVQGKVR
jgi:sigma-B regulation protein RsbU (phosphoserine phosphatase)